MKIKHFGFTFLVLATVVSGSTSIFSASNTRSDDNWAYTLSVPDYQGNSTHTDGRYRQTTNTNNPWKIDQTSTTEGTGSSSNKTHYWLETYDGSNVSHGYDVSSSDGPIYKNAYGEASQATVYLTAENNNFNSDEFTVKGFWDEETW